MGSRVAAENTMSVAELPLPPNNAVTVNAVEKLVIIGGGMAGYGLCERLVKRGLQSVFKITIFGEEPRPAYDRVNLSKLFAGRTAEDLQFASAQWYQDVGIDLKVGRRIVSIDRQKQQLLDDQGQSWDYDRLVLSTGSRPWVPPIPGADSPGVFVYRTVEDLIAIQRYVEEHKVRTAAAIGGGLLGLEASKVLLDLGVAPSVIEMAPGLMPRQLDSAAAKILKTQVEALGVEVFVTRRTQRFEAIDGRLTIHFQNADPLTVDMIVVAAGIRPRDELAVVAGLHRGARGGFAVNEKLETIDPNIYAIGECASFRNYTYGLVSPCYRMADTLADRLAGVDNRFKGSDESAELKLLGIPVVVLGRAIGESTAGVILKHHDEHGYRKVILEQGRIIGAAGVGEWDDIDMVRMAVGRQQQLWPHQRLRFTKSGRVSSAGAKLPVHQWPGDATVCSCMGVTRAMLSKARESGAKTSEDLASITGASTACGTCRHLVCELAGEPQKSSQSKGGIVMLAASMIALVVAIGIVALEPIAFATSVQDSWRKIDVLWRDNIAKQITGYSLLTLSMLGMVFSLRKRTRWFKFGSYGFWRVAHTVLGMSVVIGLIAHTGLRMGANLNLLLSSCFIGLTIVGSCAGMASGLESRLTGELAMMIRAMRPRLTRLHIYLFWPMPILVLLHIISVYWY